MADGSRTNSTTDEDVKEQQMKRELDESFSAEEKRSQEMFPRSKTDEDQFMDEARLLSDRLDEDEQFEETQDEEQQYSERLIEDEQYTERQDEEQFTEGQYEEGQSMEEQDAEEESRDEQDEEEFMERQEDEEQFAEKESEKRSDSAEDHRTTRADSANGERQSPAVEELRRDEYELTEHQSNEQATQEIDEEHQAEDIYEGERQQLAETEDLPGKAIETGDGEILHRGSNHLETISPRTLYKDASATVRFLLLPSQQVATVRFSLTQALCELKQQIASEMKINPRVLVLMLEGKKVPDESNLFDLGVHPNGTIQLQLHSIDPMNHPIQAFRPRQEYHMPDVITVRIPIDNQRSRDVVVEIMKETARKPWLGGYRDKRRQIVYHNAAVQTVPKPRPPPSVERYSRDTQTSELKNITQQTTNEISTQMTAVGTYVSCQDDRLIAPGQYKTADEFHSVRLNKAIIIQKYYRRWLAKRRVAKIRAAEKHRRDWEKQEEILKKKEKEARIQREYERRMNPKTKEDFDLLYHALEKWRQEEEERINSTLSGAERKAALYMLLEQETQLIAAIGRHKIEANSENKNKLIKEFLEKAAAPKKWKGRDGKTTEMSTPYTLRAQQLKDIYNSINMKYLTQDERLDVLLTLKHTVKEHDCKLTQEIIKLIDREADLLMRGVQETNLDGLRKRIATLFMEYIKTPLFNPEAARLLKVPQDPSVLRQNIYFCPSCTRYLPSTEFKLSSNSKTVNRCRKCIQKNNEACVREDHSHFRYILRHVCRSEEALGTESKIAFLMQESDIRYLVENVWDSQSVLSAMDDLYELVLVRWNPKEEWSPWNCVLLTKEEASAHAKLENVDEAYGEEFLHRVRHKHTLAKSHFARLPKMTDYLRLRRDNSASAPVSAVPTLSGKRMTVTPAAV